jgi:hypothetical protein
MPIRKNAVVPTSPAIERASAATASSITKTMASYRAASSHQRSREPTIALSPDLWRFSAAVSHKALVALCDERDLCVEVCLAQLDIPANLKEGNSHFGIVTLI